MTSLAVLVSLLAPPEVERAAAFYASQPIYMRPRPPTEVPEGLPDLRASTCGACHQEIYAEWRVSTHARAWMDDAQFQEELKKSRTGHDVGWMCVNCHTPVWNQLPKLVAGGAVERPIYVDNPEYDPVLQLEAITCATCHVRDGVVLGPWGDTEAPHAVAHGEELLTSEVCTRCHQAEAEFRHLSLACVFDTGGELSRGPHRNKTCQSCHMPEIVRPASALGTPPRKTRRHWFGGSLIPKKPEFADELEPLKEHYPDGLAARWVALPTSLPAGERRTLTFEVRNAEAGHLLPTGDPERFILVKAEAVGPGGEVLASREERIGAFYKWYPQVKKLSDTRLAPKERRAWHLTFTTPASGQVRLRLRASKHRISDENMRYHRLEGRYVASRVFIDRETPIPVAPEVHESASDSP